MIWQNHSTAIRHSLANWVIVVTTNLTYALLRLPLIARIAFFLLGSVEVALPICLSSVKLDLGKYRLTHVTAGPAKITRNRRKPQNILVDFALLRTAIFASLGHLTWLLIRPAGRRHDRKSRGFRRHLGLGVSTKHIARRDINGPACRQGLTKRVTPTSDNVPSARQTGSDCGYLNGYKKRSVETPEWPRTGVLKAIGSAQAIC